MVSEPIVPFDQPCYGMDASSKHGMRALRHDSGFRTVPSVQELPLAAMPCMKKSGDIGGTETPSGHCTRSPEQRASLRRD